MTNYMLKHDIHRWKQGQVVSDSELLSEGVVISQWVPIHIGEVGGQQDVKDNKIFVAETKTESKLENDLNNDNKVDAEDGKIASKTLNFLKGRKRENK